MVQAVRDFGINLAAGVRFAVFARSMPSDFRFALDQVVLLLILDLLLTGAVDFLSAGPVPGFNPTALPLHTLGVTAMLFAAYVLGRLIGRSAGMLQLAVLILSAAPVLATVRLAVVAAEVALQDRWMAGAALTLAYPAYLLALLGRAGYLVSGRLRRFVPVTLAVFLLFWGLPAAYYPGDSLFKARIEDDGADEDAYRAYREMDAEALFHSQHRILGETLQALQGGRPGISDLYFVTFAGYAYEDVFMREVEYAQALFRHRFGTGGRAVNLVNHLRTRESLPLASVANLRETLRHIGTLIDPAEDVVLLYLTSHGSEDHELAVEFWPLPLNDLTPETLREMLEEAGIKWRIVIVSACYSGGFMAALEDAYSAVATAAAADRSSFGCSNERDFTYFGEALFKGQLSHGFSFTEAFSGAAEIIAERERRENLIPSLPQVHVGEAMAAKLPRLEAELAACRCATNRRPGCPPVGRYLPGAMGRESPEASLIECKD